MKLPYILREMTEADKPYIYNSFMKYFHEHSLHSWVPSSIFFPGQTKVIDFLFRTATTLIACFPEDPEEALGWMIYQPEATAFVLHFIYIRDKYCGQGMGKEMVRSLLGQHKLLIATHMTQDYPFLRHLLPEVKVIYDPFFITERRLLENR